MQRVDPPLAADERTMLAAFLDLNRATMLAKIDGVDDEGLHRALPPSTLTLAALVKHLAQVEDGWFNDVFAGRPTLEPWATYDDDNDAVIRSAADDDAATLIALYEAACERSRAVVAAASLDDEAVLTDSRTGAPFTLRWILVHMIEETARHNGHADLIREAIDGSVGE